jgi:nitrogen fixation-related uncharacterized protein
MSVPTRGWIVFAVVGILAAAVDLALTLDALQGLICFLWAVDEGQPDLAQLQAFELREDRVPECFGRDAGAVGHKENGSISLDLLGVGH